MRSRPPHIERHVPLALLAAMLLQAATAIWWAAEQSSRLTFQDTRLTSLEHAANADTNRQRDVIDRLARIEERLAAQFALLTDLKNK